MGATLGATHVQSSILQNFTKPQYTDKLQMNSLFVAHVQYTLNLVIVISGGHGMLKVAVPSTQCVVYLLRTCGVSLVSFQMRTDS